MQPIQNFVTGILADIIRRQPPSPERTAFAWQLAVGPALARVTSVRLDEGELVVSAKDDRWLKEIERSRAVILQKLQYLLGRDAVNRVRSAGSLPRPPERPGADH